jgi:lanosterol synthase
MATSTGVDREQARLRKAQGNGNGKASGHLNGKAKAPATDSFPPLPTVGTRTDYTRWRVKDVDSNHTWHYLEDDKAAEEWPQSYAEKYFLGLPLVCPASEHVPLMVLTKTP